MDETNVHLLDSQERFLTGLGAAGARKVIARSWMRAVAAGVRTDAVPPAVIAEDEVNDVRNAHPRAAVYPILAEILGQAAEACDMVMAIGDTSGRLLWVDGRPDVLTRAEAIQFVPGTRWDECSVGTNAPGTTLLLDTPVTIRSAEHYTHANQKWSCAAAPIHDPGNGLLGFIDVTGGESVATPQSLAMVRSAARMAESELGRLALLGQLHRPLPAGIRVDALGRPAAQLGTNGQTIELSLRHSEILIALAANPTGLTGDQLAVEVWGDAARPSTMRAELTRMRAILGDQLDSRPYRLTGPVAADWLTVEQELDGGRARGALHAYHGSLLPTSDAPVVAAIRDRLDYRLRAAVLATRDIDLLLGWTQSRWGADDLEAWEQQLAMLPAHSPLGAATYSRVARLGARCSGRTFRARRSASSAACRTSYTELRAGPPPAGTGGDPACLTCAHGGRPRWAGLSVPSLRLLAGGVRDGVPETAVVLRDQGAGGDQCAVPSRDQ